MAIKVNANKLIKRLDCYRGGCDESYYIGFNAAIDRAIEIVESEVKKAKAKKKAKKGKQAQVIPIQNTLVHEMCPYCENEVVISWDVDADGYEIYCPCCGKQMKLCQACQDRGYECDVDSHECCHEPH